MITELLSRKFVYFDGAMGTMLDQNGLRPGEYPDVMNMTAPDVVESIHRMYAEAGSDILCTNTFGANARNMKGRYEVSDLITAAVQTAKRAGGGKTLTALDMGPIGDFMEPVGTLKFEEAYELFREQAVAGAAAGADLVAIETMSDLGEVKAAILAVQEHTNLPIFVTMTFGKNGRTLTGGLPESFALTAQGLCTAAVGINCSLGPKDIFPIAERLGKYTDLPLIIKPNAGLPNGKTGKYDIGPDAFAEEMAPFASVGAKVVGGCCGTTPEYIEKLCAVFGTRKPARREKAPGRLICSPTKTVNIDRMPIPDPAECPSSDGDFVHDAVSQAEGGSGILCLKLPENWDPEDIGKAVREIRTEAAEPLYIFASDPDRLEAALRAEAGIAAVSCETSDPGPLLPVIQKYGAVLI